MFYFSAFIGVLWLGMHAHDKKTNVSLLKTPTAQMKGNTVIIRNDANLEES